MWNLEKNCWYQVIGIFKGFDHYADGTCEKKHRERGGEHFKMNENFLEEKNIHETEGPPTIERPTGRWNDRIRECICE